MRGAWQRSSGAVGQRDHAAIAHPAPLPRPAALPTCLRCNFPVPLRAMGCKNPCPNCGTLYPLGDCSD
jgi:hypothetical protein